MTCGPRWPWFADLEQSGEFLSVTSKPANAVVDLVGHAQKSKDCRDPHGQVQIVNAEEMR